MLYNVGLGMACAIARGLLPTEEPRQRALRDRLRQRLTAAVPVLALNGPAIERLPNTLNVSFSLVDGEELLAATPLVAASIGSACRTDPSSVLLAMGMSRERALGAVRLSLGKYTTAAEGDRAAIALAEAFQTSP